MRSLAIALLLAGCNQVFDIGETRVVDGGVVVIEVDAARALRIDPLSPFSDVHVEDVVALETFAHGPPNENGVAGLTASSGLIVPGSVELSFDANGVAAIASSYVAPTTPGADTITIDVLVDELRAQTSAAVPVADLDTLGFAQPLPTASAMPANIAAGIPIMVSAPVRLKRIGLHVANAPAGTMVQGAVYTASTSGPGTGMPVTRKALVAATAVTTGRNEFSIADAPMLAAGRHWVFFVFSAAVSLTGSTQNTPLRITINFPFTTQFPDTWTSGTPPTGDLTYGMFMRVAN